jgi:hypothetical protein
MKNIFYILLLLPTIIFAQYPNNSGHKITLGEQTTADGLIYRGVLGDTLLITPSSDTSAYIILDTVNHRFYNYNRATNVWSMAGVGSISSGLTGVLPVANGGTNRTTMPDGYILHGDGTSVDTSLGLFWDRTNNRLGINNNLPSTLLYIIGGNGDQLTLDNKGERYTQLSFKNNASVNKAYVYYDNNTSRLEFGGTDNTAIALITDNSEKMRVNTNGEVWIGYTTDQGAYTLQVNGNVFFKGSTSVGPESALNVTNSSDNSLLFVRNDGNVGIGNSSPGFKLDVTGSGRFTGALTASSSITGGAITLTGGTDYGYISDANSFRRIWFENTLNYRTLFDLPFSRSNFAFRDSTGTPKATISSTGVGTFSGVIATSFEVGNGQYYKARRNSSNLLIDLLGIESGTDDTRLLITGDYNIKDCCSTLFKLTSAGAVTIPNLAGINDVGADANGKLQAATSDMNLKNTIENSPFGLNEILLLNPVTFLYNDTNRKIDSDVKEVGFIAQDVFDIIPNAVSSTGTGDLQLDYRAITATLVKAIQEQQALIKALEQRIINLENK